MASPLPEESDRIEALHRYQILDTPPEPAFDRITRLTAELLHTPYATIAFVNSSRTWMKSRLGLEPPEIPRDASFAAYNILQDGALAVEDAREDARFAQTAFVAGPPAARAYAGVPLKTADGFRVGSLAVLDTHARHFDPRELEILEHLAAIVMDQLELRREYRAAARVSANAGVILEAEERIRTALKMAAISRLAGGVAHVLNNLLTIITGYGQLLRLATPETDRTSGYIDEITAAADRAAVLTANLLAFSDRNKGMPTPLDLNQLIQEAMAAPVRPVRAGIDLDVDLCAGLAPILSDRVQLQQAILELLQNAANATSPGGCVTVRTTMVSFSEASLDRPPDFAPGDYVVLAVEDSGEGIDRETREHLFEPVFSTRELGKGVGLAAAYELVKRGQGEVSVTSAPGQGTTISFYFPAARN